MYGAITTTIKRMMLLLIVMKLLMCCSAKNNLFSRHVVVHRIRGGSLPLEPNPNYYYNYNNNNNKNNVIQPNNQLETLGEWEQRNNAYYSRQQQQSNHYHLQDSPNTTQSLGNVIRDFLKELQRLSPTLLYGFVSSMVVFVMWQFPFCSTFLQRHFVCSTNNILHNKRIHSFFLSTISHASLRHLFFNLYAFFTFGSSLQKTNTFSSSTNGYYSWQLWQFCFGAAILSNLFFLLLSSSPNNSCIGLSGVTLALLALYAQVFPSSQLGFIVHFIPIRLPAQHILTILFLITIFGLITNSTNNNNNNIAHATHLGGLLFGLLFHQLGNHSYFQKYFKPQQSRRHKRFHY